MNQKSKMLTIFIVLATFLLYLGNGSYSHGAEVIKIGMTPDLTGRTSEVGIPWADGIKDYFQYINEKGGINGKKN